MEIRDLCQACLFVLSMWGYLFALSRLTGISRWYVPAVCISAVGLCLYAGALLGRLAPVSDAVLLGGAACFVWFLTCVSKGETGVWRWSLHGVCIGAGMAVFLVLSTRLRLTHYDNFSHWALTVKYLLLTDNLPGAGSSIVPFRDYPPGSSLFVYYVCRCAGHGQGMMLLGQNSMLLACFGALFGVIKEKRRFLLYSFLGMGCAMLSYLNLTVRINNLLVDFLLPLFALASIAYSCREEKNFRLLAVQVLLLGFTGIIKDTGLFFAGAAGVYAAYRMICNAVRGQRRERGKDAGTGVRRKGMRGLGTVLLLFLLAAGTLAPYLLWQRHVRTELAGFEGQFRIAGNAEAGKALHLQIIRDFLRAATDRSDRAFQVFVLCVLCSAAASASARAVMKCRWKLWKVLLADILLLALWYAGMGYLYLYVMPEAEAVRLAGFDRYACSGMTLFAGILILCAVTDIEGSFAVDIDERGAYRAYSSPGAKRRYQYLVFGTFVVAVNFLYSEFSGLLVIRDSYGDSLPGRAEALAGDRWRAGGETDDRRYLILAPDEDGQMSDGEVRYVFRYFLWAEQVDVMAWEEENIPEEVLEEYDCVIRMEP